jgi:hypothetical protein
MVKKLFALASVTALTGLVSAVAASGCSSTTEVTEDSGAATDAKADTKKGDTGPGEEEDAATCKKAGASFSPPTINPPEDAKNLAACSDTVINALADACAKEPGGAGCKTAREVAGNQKDCADCLFGAETDAKWKMINLRPGQTPDARYNQAGCITLAGGVPDCGKKYFTVVSCFDAFCSDCTGAEETACQKDVAQGSGECKQYLIDQACGNALDAVEKTCFPGEQTDAAIKTLFVNMAKTFCAKGAATDGG